MAGITSRLKHAWNAFTGQTESDRTADYGEYVSTYSGRPDRPTPRFQNERSIISAIYNRIAIDVASADIRHIKLDENERFLENVDSNLNNCFRVEANIDQGARHFVRDIVHTLFDEGCIALVPIDVTLNPNQTAGWDVLTMRIGIITSWYPDHVRVSVFNQQKQRREEIRLAKKYVAIIENPFYTVMNEPNSTLQRLLRKLYLLDVVDEATSSGKLDLIIQLPYVVKSESRRTQAEQRRTDIEWQLKGSKYGIAYTDGTEKIVQLNRPTENKLLEQISYLFDLLYSQLGITKEIMDGTADEAAMINYFNRTVAPVLEAIVEAMRRTFLTKTARTQGQWVDYYRDPFKFVPISTIAEIADKFTRNEIASSNEIRTSIGWKPSKDPKADKLENSNMPAPSELALRKRQPIEEGDSQNGSSTRYRQEA